MIAMILLIALPLVGITYQSMFREHQKPLKEVQTCTADFLTNTQKCETSVAVDFEKLKKQKGIGEFVGLKLYGGYKLFAFEAIGKEWEKRKSLSQFIGRLFNLPFYNALIFTLTYTFVATPFVILLGLIVAFSINNLTRSIRGPVIFAGLLPMIITPLIGALVLFWMIDGNGIIGSAVQFVVGDPDLSLKASTPMVWVVILIYGIWHSTPFAMIVFYAGLQTVSSDQIEAAMIDGGSRWDRMRYVVLPHLMPLIIFVTLIHLMDAFRVFEPIIGFSAEAHVKSISFLIYESLVIQEDKLWGTGSATSVVTVIMVLILLTPVLIRTWRDFRR
ncbi:binding-protein-dependent transport systems inner membrane component [hydrothermal vent metagenome]|uniref:Binding-protein-dependent transport systems inner membrane component n=1 Tax=hydrothermal vent metagenome TaxID=652676 RepID=A0A160TU38_9ZZZZ